MQNNMSEKDYFELERRRLIENVTESVESALRKRYTWLAIIVSFLIGGGVATAILTLTSGAQKTLIETEVLLTRAKNSLDQVDNLSGSIQNKYTSIDRDLTGLFEGKNIFIDRLREISTRLDATDSKLEKLINTVNSMIDQSTSINGLMKIPLNQDNANLISINKIELSRYTIYLHYSTDDDKKLIEELSNYLKNLGYVIPGIQKVTSKVRDIRYYHDEDEIAAGRLKKSVLEFFTIKDIGQNINLPLKNLGTSYPDVRTGQIEIWLFF